MVRLYAKVVGITVVLIGVVGLVLGNDSLFGVLNIDRAEDAIHLITGGALAAAGFFARDIRVVRAVVGGIGIAYLAVGLVAFARPMFFGLIPHGYNTVLDNLIHLTLGVLGIGVGFFLGNRATEEHRRPGCRQAREASPRSSTRDTSARALRCGHAEQVSARSAERRRAATIRSRSLCLRYGPPEGSRESGT